MKHTHTIERYYVVKNGTRHAANESLKGLRVDLQGIENLRKYLKEWHFAENVDFEVREVEK